MIIFSSNRVYTFSTSDSGLSGFSDIFSRKDSFIVSDVELRDSREFLCTVYCILKIHHFVNKKNKKNLGKFILGASLFY